MKKVLLPIFVILLGCQDKRQDLAQIIIPAIKPTPYLVTFIQNLKSKPSNERYSELEKNQWVNNSLIMYARDIKVIPSKAVVDSIVYYWGTVETQAYDSSGKITEGTIIDNLVSFIYIHGIADPKGIIVYGMNSGVPTNVMKKMTRLGPLDGTFIIEKHKGITTYTDYRTSLIIGKSFNLPFHTGKTKDVSYNYINIHVNPGDSFNLRTMSYVKAR